MAGQYIVAAVITAKATECGPDNICHELTDIRPTDKQEKILRVK